MRELVEYGPLSESDCEMAYVIKKLFYACREARQLNEWAAAVQLFVFSMY